MRCDDLGGGDAQFNFRLGWTPCWDIWAGGWEHKRGTWSGTGGDFGSSLPSQAAWQAALCCNTRTTTLGSRSSAADGHRQNCSPTPPATISLFPSGGHGQATGGSFSRDGPTYRWSRRTSPFCPAPLVRDWAAGVRTPLTPTDGRQAPRDMISFWHAGVETSGDPLPSTGVAAEANHPA